MSISFRASFAIIAGTLALAVPAVEAGGRQTATQKPAATKPSSATDGGSSASRKFVPKRLPWGDPDISGNFTTKDEANTPFERPDEFAGRRIEDVTKEELARAIKTRQRQALADAPYPGGGSRDRGVAIAVPIHWFDNLDAVNSRPWFVVDPPDGKVPPTTEEAKKRLASAAEARRGRGTADSFTDRSLFDRCIVRGIPPLVMTPVIYGNSYQILQTKDYVAIRYEMVHEIRIIPIDGRAAARTHSSPVLRRYFGDATARWEGDTLVVDTTNFHPLMNYRGSSDALHLVERFTRVTPTRVGWSATIEDPRTWTRPWTFSMPLTEDDSQPIHEYACHEGNYGLRNILSAGRSDDKKGIKSSNNVDAQEDLSEFAE